MLIYYYLYIKFLLNCFYYLVVAENKILIIAIVLIIWNVQNNVTH